MIAAAVDVGRTALAEAAIAPGEIGLVTSVSCTGFMIPAVDAHVANALDLGPSLARLPITQAGCAGGAVGLARTADFLAARPASAALLIAAEFPSLTFQRWDRSPTNVVSTALFGDGAAAAVLVGRAHPAFGRASVLWEAAASRFFPDSLPMMGFRLRNAGLQIVLDKALGPFVRRHAGPALAGFLDREGVDRAQLTRFALHPGGRKVIESLAAAWGLREEDLGPTRRVLRSHGNMSSVTVLHVLAEVLSERPRAGERGLLAAFGPGFGAELALLRFA
jgi:alkylresorcinol/alkylpyrone synthase